MYNLLLTILLVLSVVIVIAIFMQPTKNQSSNVFDASAGDLFERSKARGFEAVMQRLTGILVFFYLGGVVGPMTGSAVAGQFGYHSVFYATAACVALSCLYNLVQFRSLLKVKEISCE